MLRQVRMADYDDMRLSRHGMLYWIRRWTRCAVEANRVCDPGNHDFLPPFYVDDDPRIQGKDVTPLVAALTQNDIGMAEGLLSYVPDVVNLHVPLQGYGPVPMTVVELAESGLFQSPDKSTACIIEELLLKGRQFPVGYHWKATAVVRRVCRLPDDISRILCQYAGLPFPDGESPFAIAAQRARKRRKLMPTAPARNA